MTYIDRVMASTRPSVTLDPLVSTTGRFTIYCAPAEEERGPIVSEMIADNAYAAIGQAMSLSRPYAGEVFTATWYDNSGTKREVSVKVLDRR